LLKRQIKRPSLATSSNEYSPTAGDEVEDLYDLLADTKTKLDFDAVCSGAILSDYQRIRVENV
jgi:diphthine-ammonia ligase